MFNIIRGCRNIVLDQGHVQLGVDNGRLIKAFSSHFVRLYDWDALLDHVSLPIHRDEVEAKLVDFSLHDKLFVNVESWSFSDHTNRLVVDLDSFNLVWGTQFAQGERQLFDVEV